MLLDRLVPHCQPIVDLASDAIVGAEMFVRLADGGGGVVPVMRWLPQVTADGSMTRALVSKLPEWVHRFDDHPGLAPVRRRDPR